MAIRSFASGVLVPVMLALAASCGGAKSGPGLHTDGGRVADRGAPDRLARDTSVPDALTCGSTTCGPDQYCLQGCSGISSMPPPPSCMDIPASCGGTVSCGCLGYPDGGHGLFCMQTGPRNVTLTGCP